MSKKNLNTIDVNLSKIIFTASGDYEPEENERGEIVTHFFSTVALEISCNDLPDDLKLKLHDFVLDAYRKFTVGE